jgi:hypothetical protein
VKLPAYRVGDATKLDTFQMSLLTGVMPWRGREERYTGLEGDHDSSAASAWARSQSTMVQM